MGRPAEPAEQAVSDLTFVDGQQGWAVGGRGLILHTADGGKTWVAQNSGEARDIVTVAFADSLHGYAACENGVFLTTADGGATWTRVLTRGLWVPSIGSLAAGSDGKLWAALGGRYSDGRFPRLAWSRDGGRRWRYADVSRVDSVWDVTTSAAGVYAVGPLQTSGGQSGASQVLCSHDGGATWQRHVVGASVQLGAIAAGGSGALCAVGDVTATSVDDGVSWSGRSTHPAVLGSIDMVGPSEAWAVGDSSWSLLGVGGARSNASNPLLHTSDGATWAERFNQAGEYFDSVDFADALHGWAVGSRGLIRHTVDGGTTWSTRRLAD